MHPEMMEAKLFRTFIRVHSMFKRETLSKGKKVKISLLQAMEAHRVARG
jgi:hypothetical protein